MALVSHQMVPGERDCAVWVGTEEIMHTSLLCHASVQASTFEGNNAA